MTELPQLSLYRRVTAAALVLGPILLLIDNVLHPKEFATGDHKEGEQLREIAQHYGTWQLAHLIGFGAIIVFTAGTLGLAFMVRRRAPLLGLVGGALGVLGLLGFAGTVVLDGFSWGILGEVSGAPHTDAYTSQLALHDLQRSVYALPYYGLAAAFIAGLITLAVGAMRAKAFPGWVGVMLAVGTLAVGLETAIHSNAYFVVSAVLLLIGAGGAGLGIAAMSDEEFANGGPG